MAECWASIVPGVIAAGRLSVWIDYIYIYIYIYIDYIYIYIYIYIIIYNNL